MSLAGLDCSQGSCAQLCPLLISSLGQVIYLPPTSILESSHDIVDRKKRCISEKLIFIMYDYILSIDSEKINMIYVRLCTSFVLFLSKQYLTPIRNGRI